MKITVSNEIIIEDPTPAVIRYCKEELVLDNPEYEKKQRMGFWTGNTPRKLYLYRVDGNRIICPVGTFYDLACKSGRAENKNEICGNFAACTAPAGEFEKVKITLYGYQAAAVDAMKGVRFGILQAPAGSGKTQMGIALIAKLGRKALWLTHTRDLLKQSYDRAVSCGMDKKTLGTITGGKVDIGSTITFATVQTMAKLDLSQYRDTWEVVIVDECHRCAGTPTAATQFSKVLNALAAGHKYGLSATVHRADGLIKTTYALLGPIAYSVPEEAVKSRVMPVKIKRVDTDMEMPQEALEPDGTINYTRLISALAMNQERNDLISLYLTLSKDHYNLILSDRLDQLRELYEALPPHLKKQAAVIDGKMTSKKAKAEREQAIEDMRSGKKRFLFASYKLAKEGLDIPRLDRLFMATPQKDYAVIVQSIGRIARTFPEKADPMCYDFTDGWIGVLQGAWKKRCTTYKKSGCTFT